MNKTMVTVIIIAVITGVGVLFFLGTLSDAWYFFQQPKNCAETPFAKNCDCIEGDEKLKVEYFGAPRWLCENENKLIDIDVADWETEAEQHAINQLAELSPNCDMRTCDRSETSWDIIWGYHEFDKRVVKLDCNDAEKGFRFATVQFDIVEGAVIQASCANFNDIVQNTVSDNPMTLDFEDVTNRLKQGYILTSAKLSSRCQDKDNGIGISTVYAPEGNIGAWKLIQGGFSAVDAENGRKEIVGSNEGQTVDLTVSGNCEIIESTQEFATINCDTQCPHVPFSGSTIAITGTYTDSYFDEKVNCFTVAGDRFVNGETIVCNDDSTKYECVEGDWEVLTTPASATTNRCPA